MSNVGVDLNDLDGVKDAADMIVARLSSAGTGRQMPPRPDASWTATQVKLLQQWINEVFPP